MTWSDWLLQHEVAIRLSSFVLIFTIMASWEWCSPCRHRHYSRLLRWSNNLSLTFLNTGLLRLAFPVAAVATAHFASQAELGLLNWLQLPFVVSVILSVLVLDLLIYTQHLLMHKLPWLWRLHRVHHADPDYDVTTGARFHPVEILLSMLIKMLAILLLGPAAVAVLIFEVLLNASAMFNHANVQLPAKLDRYLRLLLVTPDMHRVHHSQIQSETDSNYGFLLPWWDRLFSTYQNQPQKGHAEMEIGLTAWQQPKDICFLQGMLMLPFRKKD